MDNLALHKLKGVEEALHAVGAWAWIPQPCSPDFNPIEQAWSEAKSWLRKKVSPNFRRLVQHFGRGLANINHLEALTYFSNASYTLTPTSNPF